jgi:hypothetical protein
LRFSFSGFFSGFWLWLSSGRSGFATSTGDEEQGDQK